RGQLRLERRVRHAFLGVTERAARRDPARADVGAGTPRRFRDRGDAGRRGLTRLPLPTPVDPFVSEAPAERPAPPWTRALASSSTAALLLGPRTTPVRPASECANFALEGENARSSFGSARNLQASSTYA